ncbi:MAG: histidine--tRNA ligase [Candidatus Promineifilaceae bacterium]
MPDIQRATGMRDVLPEERPYWDAIIVTAIDMAQRYGYLRVDIPIIEYTELFTRGVGTASDFFIKKEMYTLDEGEGRSITLRPEFTAGIVRAYIENGMGSWSQPVKVYTIGPLFRRESPQAARFRQHSQFNPEVLGEIDPAADVEIMMIALNLHRELGYKNLTFQLNSTGCPACKPNYVVELKRFLSGHTDKLAPVDKERMQRNPLRILDTKEEGMEQLLAEAPVILDYLCDDCDDHFQELRRLLDALKQSYEINNRLVRGIDYYTKTVFELWDQDIGAQSSLCGGGRYDGLSEAIGGPPLPAVGVGIGIERIIIGMRQQDIDLPDPKKPVVMVAHFGGNTKPAAIQLAYHLRDAGIGTRMVFARSRRSMKSQMREADRNEVSFTAIIGESELEIDSAMIKNMGSGEQTLVRNNEIIQWFQKQLGSA